MKSTWELAQDKINIAKKKISALGEEKRKKDYLVEVNIIQNLIKNLESLLDSTSAQMVDADRDARNALESIKTRIQGELTTWDSKLQKAFNDNKNAEF